MKHEQNGDKHTFYDDTGKLMASVDKNYSNGWNFCKHKDGSMSSSEQQTYNTEENAVNAALAYCGYDPDHEPGTSDIPSEFLVAFQ